MNEDQIYDGAEREMDLYRGEIARVTAERDRLRERNAVLLAALREIGEGDPVHGMTVRDALKDAGTEDGQ